MVLCSTDKRVTDLLLDLDDRGDRSHLIGKNTAEEGSFSGRVRRHQQATISNQLNRKAGMLGKNLENAIYNNLRVHFQNIEM